jgi:flagellar protein FlaF
MNRRSLTVYATQLEAYRTVQKTSTSGREIEAIALTNAAMKLKECQNKWENPNRDDMLHKAVRYNQMIWSMFQSELFKKDNPLPKQLRQYILSLGVFIDKRLIDSLAFPSPEKLNIVININLSLAAGLRDNPQNP